jgi:hypothetical protein
MIIKVTPIYEHGFWSERLEKYEETVYERKKL